MDGSPIRKPIFVIGTGRCGSTVVFEALSHHEDLAWFSNYNDKFPQSDIASVAPRVYDLPFSGLPRGEKPQHRQGTSRLNRLLPKPSECYDKWEYLCGEKFRRDFLVGTKATPEERNRVRRAVRATLFWQGKPRFAAKITGPSRIEYLHSIFPDAQFVHVVRDPVAVLGSLLNVDFWKDQGAYHRPMWENGLAADWKTEWERYGRTPLALAALQYRRIFEVCRREQGFLGPAQYLEIAYEDFVANTTEQMQRIFDFCGLRPSEQVFGYVGRPGQYVNMNHKHSSRFTDRERAAIAEILGAGTDVPVTASVKE